MANVRAFLSIGWNYNMLCYIGHREEKLWQISIAWSKGLSCVFQSGKVIERWFLLTHEQPTSGQGRRCCPLHNRAESGPGKDSIRINGGRGRSEGWIWWVKKREVFREQSPKVRREKSFWGSGCLQKLYTTGAGIGGKTRLLVHPYDHFFQKSKMVNPRWQQSNH